MLTNSKLRLLFLFVAVSGLFCQSSDASAQDSDSITKLSGTVENLATGTTETVNLTLKKTVTGCQLIGEFGNKKLFGRFNIKGGKVLEAKQRSSYLFKGYLDLGNDGSNFPVGTKVGLTVSIRIGSESASAVYKIDPLPTHGWKIEQFGTMKLIRK